MFFIINNYIISLLFIICKTKIIVLPFRSTIQNFNFETIDIRNTFHTKELYSEVSIGDPPQCINLNINTESFIYYVQPDICFEKSPSFYNYSKSKNFHVLNFGFEDEDIYDESGDGVLACDIFSFYNSTDLQTNITKNGFQFFYSTYLSYKSSKNVCGILGLGLKQRYTDYNLDTFLNTLKREELIDDYFWTYIYFEKDNDNNIINFPKINNKNIINNYEGLFILGNYFNKDFSNNNDINYFKSTLAKERDKNLKWTIIFNKIDLKFDEEISMNKDIHADLLINYDYIISTKEYFEKLFSPFFHPYLEKDICKINEFNKNGYSYQIYFCDKNLFSNDIKKFPKIHFYSRDFNYTFELEHDELFKEINNNIFFLIFKNIGKFNENVWKLGKIFLKKYQFSFNQDSKMINFFVNMKNNKIKRTKKKGNIDTKFKINYLWIIVCIICLVIGIYIGNKIIIQNRKKRANELQDEYDYKADNQDKNNNHLKEKNIEMGTKGLGI